MYGFVVFVDVVVCECPEVVFRKEGMDLISVVLCVYNYCGFTFVRTGNRSIFLHNILPYLFKHMKLSPVYGIIVVSIV